MEILKTRQIKCDDKLELNKKWVAVDDIIQELGHWLSEIQNKPSSEQYEYIINLWNKLNGKPSGCLEK